MPEKEMEIILKRFQDLEFLMLFTKLEIKSVESKLNAVLMNQGAKEEDLKKASNESFMQLFKATFEEWHAIQDSIEEIIKKAKADGKL